MIKSAVQYKHNTDRNSVKMLRSNKQNKAIHANKVQIEQHKNIGRSVANNFNTQ